MNVVGTVMYIDSIWHLPLVADRPKSCSLKWIVYKLEGKVKDGCNTLHYKVSAYKKRLKRKI